MPPFDAETPPNLDAFGPLLATHAPAPGPFAAGWALVRAVFAEPGLVDRTTKEAVATAVSTANSCWYCAGLHLDALEARNAWRAAGTDNEFLAAADRRVRRITEWARTEGICAGTGPPRPFDDRHAPELIGTVVLCHYLNRMATVCPPASGGSATVPVSVPAGPADAPRGIAESFAAAATVIDAAGRRAVPEAVRTVVSARISGWYGEKPDARHDWPASVTAALPAGDRPVARLALLIALAPEQLDRAALDAARSVALVELASWASFAAAQQVGAWLSAQPAAPRPAGTVSAAPRRTRFRRTPWRAGSRARLRPVNR